MPRLSRSDSQARTREELLRTARELFLRDGYFATSLDRVADAAGFSKGAVYSNFRNKDELCLAVIDDLRAAHAGELATAVAGESDLDGMVAALDSWADKTLGDVGWSVLEIEFASKARRDPWLREQLAVRSREIRALATELLSRHAEEYGVTLPRPADELATALLSVGVGLGLQRAIDPTVPVAAFTGSIRALASGPVRKPARRRS
jgi:AcrR family transcriptional regulator